MNDLIKKICKNEYFQRKPILTNNKLQKNKEVYKNQNLMRQNSFKFDVNLIYESKKFNSIR